MQAHWVNPSARDLGLFPARTILRRLLPLGLGSMLILAVIGEVWDVEKWSRVPVARAVAFGALIVVFGLLMAALMEWENRRDRRRWAVHVFDDLISIVDERGKRTEVPKSALDLVVVVASQTAWRDDLEIVLFAESDEPLISLPLIAEGADDLVEWLSRRKGFQGGRLCCRLCIGALDSSRNLDGSRH